MKKGFLISTFMVLVIGCSVISHNLESSEPIKIAAVFDLKKRLSVLDIPASRGAIIASEEINSSGGLFNRDIQLIVRDTGSSVNKIRQKIEQLIYMDKVQAFVGYSDTNYVLAANPPIQAARLPFISIGATSPRISGGLDGGETLALAAFGDNAQAAVAAEYAFSQFGSKAIIVFENNKDYPILFSRYFKKRFEELGGQILGSYYFVGNPPAFAPIARQIKKLKVAPDFVLLASMPVNANMLIRQIRLAGLHGPIIGGDSMDIAEIHKVNPLEVGQIYYTSHAFLSRENGSDKIKSFIQKYKDRFGTEPENSFAALGYDALMLLVEAARRAESLEADKLMAAIENIRNFESLTGAMTYARGRRTPFKPVSIIRIGSSGPELVDERMPEKMPIP
ncbi:MAG: ABC transporter substrate-binding protein [SAR324 cluster bacterium]|uniref:ABC transporter substrate-binding protein n=1 Tax=SAR324 cluster bacterium TaxID=2024889 RepID=A0A7X9IKE8_9DELT|nr:ABC transporter substrate-binding protein [SAR324 cluster bacterium]